MAYSQVTTRTTSDTNAAADVNQLQLNIEALKGGTGSVAPTTTIEALGAMIGQGTVDGVSKKLKWKVITPATPGAPADTGTSGSIQFAHGLDASKILDVSAVINYGGTRHFFKGDLQAAVQYYPDADDTNVYIYGINAAYNSCPYFWLIWFYE